MAFLSPFIPLVLAREIRKCYTTTSTEAPDDVPCTLDSTTWCCNKNDLCLSNGLCFMQRDAGLTVARGSCTDRSWTACGEFKFCVDGTTTFPITNSPYNGSNTVHCCGASTYNTTDHSTTCQHGLVSIPRGIAIPGVAALAVDFKNVSASTESAASNKMSREVVVGVGVGVPLGVMAVFSIAWALWECRGRRKVLARVNAVPVNAGSKSKDASGPAQLPGAYGAAQLPGDTLAEYLRPEIQEMQPQSPREVGGFTAVCELDSRQSNRIH
ncbi:hypothetical protein N7492_000137 [Penicillium capsulatum]|uniref:Uncharacterized protein n=1 Tax=Penicillium capsulatum TaxID=69766 RepID=A0A9W9IVB7_9EURO|nr:hypothetical protein N7492_000137 [Penicillium capsulatum]KAJ6130797.1 hypothetical protein N7512_003577 [Penicillium capsulatum]